MAKKAKKRSARKRRGPANRAKTGVRRDHATRFRSGQSGNPRGRPKKPPEVRQMLTDGTPVAIKALLAMITGKKTPAVVKEKCIRTFLAYSLGKPAETFLLGGVGGGPVQISGVDPRLASLSDEGLNAVKLAIDSAINTAMA